MSYNFLKDARSVKNSFLCRYDTLNGYATSFNLNGNVDGWTLYNNIYLYGCWGGMLFGTTYDRDCYVSRESNFIGVPGDKYYFIRILMKITNNNKHKTVVGLTTGRIQWTYIGNANWNTDKQIDFDIIDDDAWHLYEINVGPASYWQGDINNLRVYPFIDGWSGDQFAIKYIKISSIDTYSCSNTNCDYYTSYSHPCPGGGSRGSCEAGIGRSTYSTTDGVDDKLIINIDNYGDEKFDLGDTVNLSPINISKVISNKIATLNIGGYSYSEVEYSENDKLKIYSGTVGPNSAVIISDSLAARELGFFDDDGNFIGIASNGTARASGFDYASSRMLTSLDINKLTDGNTASIAYLHNPAQYNVEVGRRDFIDVGSMTASSVGLSSASMFSSFNNKSKTIIDLSHPVNNNGKLSVIYVFGNIETLSKIKIFRPRRDGTLEVIYSLDLPLKTSGPVYTTVPLNYKIDCDLFVNKGDLIGAYNIDLYVGTSLTGLPDATFQQVAGDPSVGDIINGGKVNSFGVSGFAIYARSNRLQSNFILDIDLGDRVNIEEVNIYGYEDASSMEFNIASCLDVSWMVNLYGENHYHAGFNWWTGEPWGPDYHTNTYYGLSCLDDCITTADNGQVGTSYSNNSTGLVTTGADHSYFYVNGDAEWLYDWDCSRPHEFCKYVEPGSGGVGPAIGGFTFDPISFTLLFPYGFSAKIHKSKIYFKESNNFRKMELSYYVGPTYEYGNAYIDKTMQRIPRYNSIVLDGMEHINGGGSIIDGYIFNNPTNDEAIYANGGKSDLVNVEEYSGALSARWNTIEHIFDEIECKGFRVYTNKHNSTKIMEMEVYSKMDIIPSLLDNVYLSFSDYGEIWNSAFFMSSAGGEITAFIGGAPRYFRLEIDSSTAFTLHEISCDVGPQIKLSDCGESLTIDEAKYNDTNTATAISFENVYNRPCDLYFDIIPPTFETEDILFWSKLGSEEDIADPQKGPGGRLYKNSDYYLGNSDYMCAINTPAYGLQNMIHNKPSYINEYIDDVWYEPYQTLLSGVSIGYINEDRKSLKYSIIEFPTPVHTYRYYKVGFVNPSSDFNIRDIIPYKDDARMLIDQISLSGTADTGPIIDFINSDGFTLPHPTITCINDTFDQPLSSGGWTVYQNNCTGASLSILSGYVNVVYGTAVNSGWYGPYMRKNFDSVGDFTLEYNFQSSHYSNSNMILFQIALYDGTNGRTPRLYCRYMDSTSAATNTYFYILDEVATRYTSARIGSGAFNIKLIRQGNNLLFYINGGLVYTNASWNVTDIRTCDITFYRNTSGWYFTDYIRLQDITLTGDRTDITVGGAIGVRLATTDDVINKIKLFHTNAIDLRSVSLYGSMNNTTYTLLSSSGTKTTHNANWDQYFSVDLGNRHDLNIIRHYGYLSDKFSLGLTSNIDYSNSSTNDVYSVDWGNSDYNDVRWVRIKLRCGDGTLRRIDKLGIYPDISTAYCKDGTYNCSWDPIGTILSNYDNPINIAYGATSTGTSYSFNLYPDNATDGVNDGYDILKCWGNSGSNPYIELDFGGQYLINKVLLYHGYSHNDTSCINTGFIFSVATTSGSAFTNVFTTTGNTKMETLHQFTPVYATKARLTITSYNSSTLFLYSYDGTRSYFIGAMLREIEIYTYTDTGYINSEEYPVVCMNLLDSFEITNHSVMGIDETLTLGLEWDNSEDYFKYSDSYFDDPHKVFFNRAGNKVTTYYTDTDTDNLRGSFEYTFDTGVYIDVGIYNVEWQSYAADSEGEISLVIDGPNLIELMATNLASGYADQSATINITSAGFYSIRVRQHITNETDWGARNIHIYRSSGLSKWAALTRDTATNYSFDGLLAASGIDYLSRLKIFGSTSYKPTEYNWWWTSTVSDLDNDGYMIKTGNRSLKISYPTSSGTDILQVIEGSTFGQDNEFDLKDCLHFWLYVDDISGLNTSYGDVAVGVLNDSPQYYYMWSLSGVGLHSDWNDVRLKFEDADVVYPTLDGNYLYNQFSPELNFASNNTDIKSFRIRYRGNNTQPVTMYLDDLKIQRNRFEDYVKFGKGLCLTNNDYLEIPLSGVDLEKGSIEFWVKLYTDTYGVDKFGNAYSRVLFTMVNNNNNIVSLGIKSGHWFEAIAGHIRQALHSFTLPYENIDPMFKFSRGDVLHIGLVWSNSGEYLDGDDTIRLYLNNVLVSSGQAKWDVDDTKFSTIRIGGVSAQPAFNSDTWGSAVFSNIKIYNYCKNGFNIEYENLEADKKYDPNHFVQISSDNNNFYGVGSEYLPIVFEQVPAGENRTIYIRANKNKNFSSSNSTANIKIEWLIST